MELEGDKFLWVTSESLWDSPFLAEKRLVIINGLLERFEPKAKPTPAKKAAAHRRPNLKQWQLLIRLHENLPDTPYCVVDAEVRTGIPFSKNISNKLR